METERERDSSGDRDDRREAVKQVIDALNQAWVRGRPDDLAPLFHEDVVMALPSFEGRAVGREAMVESYRDFSQSAMVHDFRPEPMEVDVFGPTAVVSYVFRIEYEMDGEGYAESGREVMVLAEEGGTWRVVWRTLFPGASRG